MTALRGATRLRALRRSSALLCAALLPLLCAACVWPGALVSLYRVTVVDAATGRGIPAVELRTTDDRSFFTDSAGVVALVDPDLMGRPVFFELRSFGYEYAQESFGRRGTVLHVAPGGSALLEMTRLNVAERLYRVTGSGIYRDSELLGDSVPLPERGEGVVPTGMDSALTAVYGGVLFWVWGDTHVLSAPLGIFRAVGATSQLPGRGGLDPWVGVDFTYFRDGERIRPMVDDEHNLIWLTALRSVRGAGGEEHLFATYQKVEPEMTIVEVGLAEFDAAAGVFHVVQAYPEGAPIFPRGPVFRDTEKGRSYLRYGLHVRSPDDPQAVRDLTTYEAYTPLRPGARLADGAEALERDADGQLMWAWKRGTPPLASADWEALLEQGAVEPREAAFQLVDVETGETVRPHEGSIEWNAHRRRWVMIRSRLGGDSRLGELYYFEADTALGPWAYGRRILTHSMPAPDARDPERDRVTYTFYNPLQHPEFQRDGGSEILFEGTFTVAFARSPAARIPRYNYNQMMYALDLEDPRLFLPVAVYRSPGPAPSYRTLEDAAPDGARWELAFFAPDRPRAGTLPVREVASAEGSRLVAGAGSEGPVRFYCAPAADAPVLTVPLYERRAGEGGFRYATEPPTGGGEASVLCHVWPKPVDYPPAQRHPPPHSPSWDSDPVSDQGLSRSSST